MKRYIKNTSLIMSCAFLMTSCGKDWLELQPRGTELEANFYQNEGQMMQGIIAAYDVLQWGNGNNNGYIMKVPLLTTASDEAAAGGSDAGDQPNWVAWDNFTVSATLGPQADIWSKYYQGIFRSNIVLEKIDGASAGEAFKNRIVAEAKFLRGYYYFELVRFFRNVPLITAAIPTSELYNQKQATPEAIYAQIEKDLSEAITHLPPSITPAEAGRVSKYAAEALLGKVILYQNDNSRMAEAANHFRTVNTAPQFRLLVNFADIFRPDNGFHAESIFEIPHSQLSSWGDWGNMKGGEGNIGVQFVGMADYSGPTFSNGWGFCPISLQLVNVLKDDPRFEHTIIDGNKLKEAGATYNARYQNTDYFIRKYAPIAAYRAEQGTPELNWPVNEIEIRLADTYLMEAEALVRGGGDATRAQSLLDDVRKRAKSELFPDGLPAVPATLENIYHERRLELATEGHRFFDLVRTGQAEAVLGPLGFKSNKNEVLPIPFQEIDWSNGIIVQNPNY